MKTRLQRGEGWGVPARLSGQMFHRGRSESKGKDWCKTYTCFARCHVRLTSPVSPLELGPTCCFCLDYLPTVTSVLRWKHRPNLNVNILAADGRNEQTEECLSQRRNHPSNERLPRHMCVLQKWPFLIRQRGDTSVRGLAELQSGAERSKKLISANHPALRPADKTGINVKSPPGN